MVEAIYLLIGAMVGYVTGVAGKAQVAQAVKNVRTAMRMDREE